MRVTKYNEAAQARIGRLTSAFRELLQSRMLWAAGGVTIVGLMAGFVFFSDLSRLPVLNRPKAPASISVTDQATPDIPPVAEEVAAIVTDEPAAAVLGSNCDLAAQAAAGKKRAADQTAEDERHAATLSRRHGAKQLLSAIAGAVLQPPADELQRYEARRAEINAAYSAALAAANCN